MTRHSLRFGTLISVTLLLLMLPDISWAADRLQLGDQTYIQKEVRLNEFTHSRKSRVCLDIDEEGRILAAWDSRRQEGGTYGVFARRLDRWGRKIGGEIHINAYTASQQMRPSLALSDDGDPWCVWESWSQDGDGFAVVGHCGGSDEVQLSESGVGIQQQPVAAYLNVERRLAVWMQSRSSEEPNQTRIVGRFFDAAGHALGAEFAVSLGASSTDRAPCVANAADGSFVVVWARTAAFSVPSEDPSPAGIMARRFDSSGRSVGGEIMVSPTGIEPTLDCTPQGEWIVGWLDLEDRDEEYHAWFRCFDRDGTPTSSASLAAGASFGGWQSGVAVAAAGEGRFALAWNTDNEGRDEGDVYARLFELPSGEALTDPIVVTTKSEGPQKLATASGARRLVLSESGALAVAWEGDSDRGDVTSANLTLLIPEPEGRVARLFFQARMALAGLFDRDPSSPESEDFSAALPHQPPVLNADQVVGNLDPEPYVPRSEFRDEGWTAITATGWDPPDPHMAIGHEHVMVMTNGAIAAYTRGGDLLWQDDITDDFWAEVGGVGFVFDPEVIFDPHENRFMAMANERHNNHSYFLLGISATDDPTGSWHKYRMDVTSFAGNDIDSPNMAVDEQAIYLTADFFGPAKYLIYVVDKASVIDGGVPSANHYLHTGTQSFGIPVQHSPANHMYMIEHFETSPSSTIRLWAIEDPLTNPTPVSITLPVSNYWPPANGRSQGTSTQFYTFDARFWSCVYRDGSLWACQHISPTSAQSSVAARWYEIRLNGWPENLNVPLVRQWGEVLPNDTGYATFNSISVNAAGEVAMCFAYSSTADRFTMMRTTRSDGDPQGQMSDPVTIKQSLTTYTGDRWGDYSATVVDPADLHTFWMTHEYAVATSTWNVWVSNFVPEVTSADVIEPVRISEMLGSYPNPSSGATRLQFRLATAEFVDLEIFDVTGARVRRLTPGQLGGGEHEILWDGRDSNGDPVASGHYLGVLEIAGRKLPGHRVTLVR